ncbi:hypothetical protein [Falsiroseomonas oryzae]|uniref:hypothetical protein n=1 Tax=Falsiroseomonas oryzae TaxID=2766473 RepID=UPI0022EA8851|nr:hypothetical protein [Roseomonas sp. MO-31]
MPSDRRDQDDAQQDIAVAGTFPASDPPSNTGERGTRAVPPGEMLGGKHAPVPGGVMLKRRFPSAEAAKLALEGLVRDGPVDRDAAELHPEGEAVELRLVAPPGDAERLRVLLARA